MAKVFKDISDKNISETGVEQQSAWLFPNERPEKSSLSSISLSRKDEEPEQGPGKQIPRYFYKVYDRTNKIEETEEAQYPRFTLTYGNRNGKGSPSFFDKDGNKTGSKEPTKAIYSQYADSLLRGRELSFGFRKDHFYAINFNSRTLKSGLVAKSLELTLSFGNNDDITLVFDKEAESDKVSIYRKSPVFEDDGKINAPNVFGAVGVPSPRINKTGGRLYGFIYPKQGVIILDPDTIAEEISSVKKFIPETRPSDTVLNSKKARKVVRGENGGFVYEGGFDGNEEKAKNTFPDWPYVRNHDKIFEAIDKIVLDVEKTNIRNSYELKVGADDFNYSANPTFSDKSGNVEYAGDKPYYTTVGLYNDDYQLLAIAKLEEPTKKEESSLSIEIEY